MKTNELDTEKYISNIAKKTSDIEAKAKTRKFRRRVFLCIILLVCFGGSLIGISDRSDFLEVQYMNYMKSPDYSVLSNELLSHKDVFEQFENTYLGNKVGQSLMGGFFYNGAEYSIYPDETGSKMILHSAASDTVLCSGLASDINVKNGVIYYRKLNSRTISSYNISSKSSSELPLKNVGQFIVCDNKIYYVDLGLSSLMIFDLGSAENVELIQSGVSSFAVVGNNVIVLDDEHNLYEMNPTDRNKTIIGKNISAFSYNGMLWIQNNEKIYSGFLDKKSIKNFTLDIHCNRLLGVSKTNIYIEADDGIYICDINTNTSKKAADGIFVGASDGKMLIYAPSERKYQVILTD